MAAGLPVPKTREVLAALEQAGFRQVSQSGSHIKLRRGSRIAIVPNHGGKDVPMGTLRAILKQADISPEELRSLL
ncbi:MAG TPA: type II toxin-antitoxin system HicA family toxin [Thermomicrobiales bacterium]|nr:type II toxin-antitoxin system HicA family toxin [Thermomicrobiales bacterium]